MLKIGIIGSLVAALCCFTPILTILLSALGLGFILAWADLVLMPALIVFLAITAFALLVGQRA